MSKYGNVQVTIIGAERLQAMANALAAAADKCREAFVELALDMNGIIEEEKAEDAQEPQDSL